MYAIVDSVTLFASWQLHLTENGVICRLSMVRFLELHHLEEDFGGFAAHKLIDFHCPHREIIYKYSVFYE